MTTKQPDLKQSIATIRAQMDELAARYPQYRGAFDSFIPVRIKATVETKMGVAFLKDEIALAEPAKQPIFIDYYRTVFSTRNNVSTRILKGDIEEITMEAAL